MKSYDTLPPFSVGTFQDDDRTDEVILKLKPSGDLRKSAFIFSGILLLSLISATYRFFSSSSIRDVANSKNLSTYSTTSLSVFALQISVASPTYGTPDSLRFLPWDAVIEPHQTQLATVKSLTLDGVAVDLGDYLYSWSIEGVEYAGQTVNMLVKSTGVKTLSVKAKPLAGGVTLTKVITCFRENCNNVEHCNA
jgi:hypothetical protein